MTDAGLICILVARSRRDMNQTQEVPMDHGQTTKPPYRTPTVRVVDEAEMLVQFQVTTATSGWWVA